MGCAVAYELARRGAAVQLVDERAAGMGATQASAGILAPHIEAVGRGPFLAFTVRSLGLFDEFIERLESDTGASIPYRRTGTLQVAADERGMQELRDSAAHLVSDGIAATLLDEREVRIEEPHLGPGPIGGLVVPAHGFVGVGELARALTVGARRHGAHIIEGSRVRRIVPGDDFIVDTDRGTLRGAAVVIAAGSWSVHVEVAGMPMPVPVRPVRGQLIRLGWNGVPLQRVIWADHCYLVPWDDGTLLVGATVEEVGFDERATVEGVRELIDAAIGLVPEARSAAFHGVRVGLRPASPDLLPIIGRSAASPNLMYATAHYRNGILLAPLTAKLVADALLDDTIDPALAGFGPQRFGVL